MKTRFTKTTAIVAAAHIIFVAGIYLIGTGFSSLRHSAIQSPSPAADSFVAFEYQQPTPPAAVTSRHEDTVIPITPATSQLRSQTARTHRSTGSRSTNVTTRVQAQQQVRRPPSAEQIMQDMLDSPSGNTGGAITTGANDLAIVRDAYHRVWLPPAKDVAGNASATALIVFEPDGRIKETRIAQASGNQALDATVALALQQISEISGLTDSILSRKEGITIQFEVAQ